jgi:hypothetical protein
MGYFVSGMGYFVSIPWHSVLKSDLKCYYCQKPATYFYRTQEDYEKKYNLKRSHFIFTCEEHALKDAPYDETSFENVLVFHVMLE